MIRIGIDEAGLGPKVGPLVISAVVFRFQQPPEHPLWRCLKEVVCRASGKRPGALVVDDSKKVYSRQRGLGRLEETVLAFLSTAGVEVAGLGELLDAVSVSGRRWTERYPWYEGASLELPRSADGLGAAQKGERLRQAMAAQGVELVGTRSLVAHPREYNRVVGRVGSKLTVLFALVARLIQRVLPLCGSEDEEVSIIADNLGGRRHYAPLIGRFFRGAAIRIWQQGREGSCYGVRWRGRRFGLDFEPKGDERHFEVALASMQSKYLRELHMELLNGYWQAQVPGLKRTAGYGRDGVRFVQEVTARLDELGLDRWTLVRRK